MYICLLYIYIYLSHFSVDLKLTHFKLNILHLIKNKDNTDVEFYLNISEIIWIIKCDFISLLNTLLITMKYLYIWIWLLILRKILSK